jgi:HlyD family secretion protein
MDGTVLQVLARLGETAAATPEQPLVVIGDLSALRVRAEVEERDVSKVRPGQAVVVRTDAYPGRDFTGRVVSISQTLATARLPQRGPKRPTDLDTLEVLIELDASPELLSGMRVDVFFKVPGLNQPASQGAAPAAAK